MENKAKVYLATLISVSFWGLSYIWSNRLLMQGVAVEYFLPLRIFIAAVLLLVFNLIRGFDLKIRQEDLKNFMLLAVCEPFIYFFCETYGIQFTASPTISSMIIASTPVMAMVAGVVFFKEKISWQHVVGLLICLVGLALVINIQGSDSRLFVFGIVVLFLAVIAEVAYASFTKALSDGYKPTVIVMHQFFIGSVCFLPLFLTRGMESFDAAVYLSIEVWEPLLCLAVLCSSLSFALWAYSISNLGVAKSSIFQALSPLVAAVAGVLLGQEVLQTSQWVGLAIALSGVVLTQIQISGNAGR